MDCIHFPRMFIEVSHVGIKQPSLHLAPMDNASHALCIGADEGRHHLRHATHNIVLFQCIPQSVVNRKRRALV